MKQILKWSLQPGHFTMSLPNNTAILKVGTQGNNAVFWGITDKNASSIETKFYVAMTGENLPDDINEYTYLGTDQLPSGIAFHAFVKPPPIKIVDQKKEYNLQ